MIFFKLLEPTHPHFCPCPQSSASRIYSDLKAHPNTNKHSGPVKSVFQMGFLRHIILDGLNHYLKKIMFYILCRLFVQVGKKSTITPYNCKKNAVQLLPSREPSTMDIMFHGCLLCICWVGELDGSGQEKLWHPSTCLLNDDLEISLWKRVCSFALSLVQALLITDRIFF